MKKHAGILLICVISISAFLAGRWTHPGGETSSNAPPQANVLRAAPSPGSGKARSPLTPAESAAKFPGQVQVEQAKLLTTAERLALVQKGALIFDSAKQAEFLCGLISVLTKDELSEATKVLGAAQDRGNYHAQEVWNSIWNQWGRVDAKACLAGLGANPQGKPLSDAKNVMKGWMETDPEAAVAWAKEPKQNNQEAAAAAHALGLNAKGNLADFSALVQSLPAGSLTAKACLQDYFDLAMISQGTSDVAGVYQQVPAALKSDAWPVAMQRLSYSDPQAAVNWLAEHVNEPGRDYRAAYPLVRRLAQDDPAATAQWAAQLPDSESAGVDAGSSHPVPMAVGMWLRAEPAAAKAWLQTQPATTPWVAQVLARLASQPGHQ